jgi:hypothetical protein
LLQCDQVAVSLKTSKDISALGFPTCCKTWQEWVTERRGAWRARVNAARLTRGKGSLSWPTATAFDFNNTPLNRIDGTGKTYKSNLKEAVHQNWPTVRASEYKDVGPVGSKSHDHMLGKHYLCAVVTQEQANWPTVQTTDSMGACLTEKRLSRPKGTQLREAVHGQAAPASSSSLGSRQGLWLTPRANEPTGDSTFVTRNGDRGQHCSPSLTIQVEKTAQWATPRSGKTTDENPETWALRQAKGDVATMPLTAQVKAWATPAAFDWNTAENKAAWEKRAAEQKSKGVNLHLPLKSQAIHEAEKQWATPQAKDHKSGHRDPTIVQYKQLNVEVEARATGKLNPRWVETLMGLPIGWTMPSCTSPQTIAPTSYDSSAMELSQPPQSEPLELSLAS